MRYCDRGFTPEGRATIELLVHLLQTYELRIVKLVDEPANERPIQVIVLTRSGGLVGSFCAATLLEALSAAQTYIQGGP